MFEVPHYANPIFVPVHQTINLHMGLRGETREQEDVSTHSGGSRLGRVGKLLVAFGAIVLGIITLRRFRQR